jgi:hypothetical protein
MLLLHTVSSVPRAVALHPISVQVEVEVSLQSEQTK